MSEHNTESDALVQRIATVLSERMDRGTSGRYIADYGVTIHSLATEIANVIPPDVTRHHTVADTLAAEDRVRAEDGHIGGRL